MILALVVSAFVIVPVAAFAQSALPSRLEQVMERREERKEVREERREARGVLREARHADRLARVVGIIRGMTNKLNNLSERLDKHVENVERRIAALESAGHDITVDAELAALKAAVADAQAQIDSVMTSLGEIPNSEKPKEVVPQVRELVRGLRDDLKKVHDAFEALRLAIHDDVRP